MLRSRPFDDVYVGEKYGDIVTVTDWHILTAGAIFYDAGPNHVNPVHSKSNRFGGIVAPGFLTTGMMMGLAGRHFGWSIEAFLECAIRFAGPVYPGDLVHIEWRVTDKVAKAAFSGGIITMHGTAWEPTSQRVVVDMTAKLALNNDQPPELIPPAAARKTS